MFFTELTFCGDNQLFNYEELASVWVFWWKTFGSVMDKVSNIRRSLLLYGL